ncbi:uncharacterized protein LOC115752375 [Rhodamnia argentea]|uniref:Uncharacterized protein LOC115752375 n=1 Tax=Rhodamnia argentea TaxID=178133 RepID=A0A8B8QGZ1_9MYRT|nr:uncharacterized protein LOC115752375 [Rhodamnia argentea]
MRRGLFELRHREMKVVVEILTGVLFSADVPSDGTVADLKQEIGAQQELPRDRLILLLCDGDRSNPIKDDEDGARLVDVGINDGSHVYLFFKPIDPDDPDQSPPQVVAVGGADASPEDQTVVHST